MGKTTTAINLSAYLALKSNKKVLLVDFDPQANATSGLGIEKGKVELSVYDLLNGKPLEGLLRETKIENLYLIPSSISLCGAEVELIEREGREWQLKRCLEGAERGFELIIIDTPPSLGILTINALVASNKVIVPIQCEYYALEGLVDFLRTLQLVKERLNPELDVLGILLTMADYRTKIAHDVEEEARKCFGEKVFHTVIHRNVRLAEAPSYGMPIELYDPNCIGAYCYGKLAEEVLKLLKMEDGKERIGEGIKGLNS